MHNVTGAAETSAVRTALVTGAANGIGAATAELLLAQGMRVVAVDRDAGALERFADQERAEPVAADLTTAAGIAAAVAAAGPIDHFVHAAGIIRLADPLTLTPDVWDAVMDINLRGTFFLTQAVIPQLTDDATAVLVASVAGKMALTTEAIAYNASKAGVIAMTKSFAYLLAPRGIRINAVAPGIIATQMQDAIVDFVSERRGVAVGELLDTRLQTVPLGRDGTSAEVAAVIRFLLSDDASYMTGQAVNISGGQCMY
jgi:NAD(P)-dependent dehydrogenase (short-subunit alcohol dehydrogenase family)